MLAEIYKALVSSGSARPAELLGFLRRRLEHLRRRSLDSQLIKLEMRLAGIAIAVGLLIQGAYELGFPGYSVLAGLGVGGLAVALASRVGPRKPCGMAAEPGRCSDPIIRLKAQSLRDEKAGEEIMKLWSRFTKGVSVSALLAVCVLALTPSARAQPTIDADAQSVLAAMSNYVGGLKSFSVDYFAVDEVITPEGQKLQFLHSGEIMVQRPDKLYITRKGAAGAVEVFLDGKALTLFSKDANAYLKLDASSIDAAIEVVHKLGADAPGADLLASKPLDSSTTDITSGAHVGMTFIDGIEVHQLAFRGADVDWQLWVMAGDKPLPVRYVITSKNISGAPEYTLELRNWNITPQTDAARFVFTPPQGAKQLDPASVTVNALGDLTIKGE